MSVGNLAQAFAFMMAQQITVAPFTGRDQYGDETWGAAKTYPARVSASTQAIYGTAGEVIVGRATIQFYPQATDGTVLAALGAEPDNAKITLPTGETPRILQIGNVTDENGATIYWQVVI